MHRPWSLPLRYRSLSIATGIGLGFITYALAKIIAGKFAEAKPAVLALAALFGSRSRVDLRRSKSV
jgi:adenine/guanine/hypoxanthine permease